MNTVARKKDRPPVLLFLLVAVASAAALTIGFTYFPNEYRVAGNTNGAGPLVEGWAREQLKK